MAADAKGLEESIASESSTGDDLGTGTTIGLPSFLAGFLQGIVDRLKLSIKNVEAKLETELTGDGQSTTPVELRLKVGHAELAPAGTGDEPDNADEQSREMRRKISLKDLALHIVSDAAIFSELASLPWRVDNLDPVLHINNHRSMAHYDQRVLRLSSPAARMLGSRRPVSHIWLWKWLY